MSIYVIVNPESDGWFKVMQITNQLVGKMEEVARTKSAYHAGKIQALYTQRDKDLDNKVDEMVTKK